MSSQVGTVTIGGFSSEKEVTAVELGGQPHEVAHTLTFCLSKVSPDAYSTYRNAILVLFYFICM
jgi:hypothetical protein